MKVLSELRGKHKISLATSHTHHLTFSVTPLSLSPEHDHGLLADIVWVLGHDEVDVLLLDPQLPAQAHPVPAQQVGDVGDAQVSPVDGVKLPVARLTQEAVLGLQKKRVGIRLTHVELLTRQIGVQVDDWEGSRLQCCGPGLFFARTG